MAPPPMRLFGTDPLLYVALAAGLILSMAMGFLTQQQTVLPVAGGLLVWPFVLWSLRHARIDIALRFVVFWAALVFLFSLVAVSLARLEEVGQIRGEVGRLFDLTGSYNAMWWMSAALGVVAALLNLPIVEKPVDRLAMPKV